MGEAPNGCDEGLAPMETNAHILHATQVRVPALLGSSTSSMRRVGCKQRAAIQVEIFVACVCVSAVQHLALMVEKHSPNYNHLCNDAAFSSALAKTRIVAHMQGVPLACSGPLRGWRVSKGFGLAPPRSKGTSADVVEYAEYCEACSIGDSWGVAKVLLGRQGFDAPRHD